MFDKIYEAVFIGSEQNKKKNYQKQVNIFQINRNWLFCFH